MTRERVLRRRRRPVVALLPLALTLAACGVAPQSDPGPQPAVVAADAAPATTAPTSTTAAASPSTQPGTTTTVAAPATTTTTTAPRPTTSTAPTTTTSAPVGPAASPTTTTMAPTPTTTTTTAPKPTTTTAPPTTTTTTTAPKPTTTTTVPKPTTTTTPPTTTTTTTAPPVIAAGTTNAQASFGFYPRYGNVSGLQQIETWLGRKATHIVQFTDISSPGAMVQSAWGELAAPGMFQTRAGISKFVESVPLAFKNQSARLQDTINGVNDSSFITVANYLVAAGHPDAVLRLGWEFDGDWMPWAAPGKESSFIAAFRHVHDVFKSVSSRFRFDFNGTTGVDGWKTTWEACYPGDAYVDIIGGDAYDRGPAVLSRLPAALKKQRDMAIAHGKQISWPEWALAGGGTAGGEGDNPAYLQAMADFMNSSPASGPGSVAYHAYFNENVPDGDHAIDSFPTSKVRFKTLFGA